MARSSGDTAAQLHADAGRIVAGSNAAAIESTSRIRFIRTI
ncbi:MAG: hypothetical protein ACRDH8_03710 [Actinomycetota bacterium]